MQKILVGGEMNSVINFAMQQNYVPVFRSLLITNKSEETLENITFRITFEPDFAHTFETVIPRLMPSEAFELSPVRIVLKPEYLASLTEKMNGSALIEAFCGDECVFSERQETELLAYDEWTGYLIMPEIIAAFVTPNHPKISEVLGKASMYLKKWCGSPSITGYQTKNPNIVKQQAAAVYAALQELNIAYAMPPASYEKIGQRLRLPDAVMDQKCGTCIDLALLYCACLERMGINPLIIFTKGHAFAGFWLEEETFAECFEDDISAITKRIAHGIDKLCVVECTDFTAGSSTDFDHAEKHAVDNLENSADFAMAVDIMRCRGSGIRPIPSRVYENGNFSVIDYGKRRKDEITNAPQREIDIALHGASSEEQEVTKQVIWERKLLDLSLRNSLLNFRPTSSVVQLITADLGVLEDEISRGEDFKIMPAPTDFTIALSDSKIYEIENEKDLITTIAESEFKSKRLRTFLKESELEKTLKKLHRQSKVSLEENGANTLYLALGFLRWFETDKSEKPRFAPLVLIPVDIVRKIQDRSYTVRIRDEEPQMNITLLEMLRQDYGVSISGLNPLPQDESGIDLPLVFNTVRQGVMSKKHWDILEYAFLGQFSFSQFIMWNDIRNRSDDLKKNKVVSSLIAGKMEWEPLQLQMSAKDLDRKLAPVSMAIPTSTDSSQLAAIYEAANGQSFVLHGPPGTGKSQTITNLIANALYQGKSVLFVAEKMAALSVVQNRLAKIGLDPFCLELHSNKAQKRAVLQQLENTLNVGHVKSAEEYGAAAEKLLALRRELNSTMEEIHKKRDCGMSLYEAIVLYEKNDANKDRFSFDSSVVSQMSRASYALWKELIQKTASAGNEIGGYADSPYKNYRCLEYSMDIRSGFEQLCGRLKSLAETCGNDYDELIKTLSLDAKPTLADYIAVVSIVTALNETPNYLPNALSDPDFEAKKPSLKQLIANGNSYKQLYSQLSSEFEQSVFDFDPDTAILSWKKNEQKWFLPRIIGAGKLVKELDLYSKQSGKITKENIAEYYGKLSDCKRLKAALSGVINNEISLFGGKWIGENSDFVSLDEALSATEKLREITSANPLARAAAFAYSANPNGKGVFENGREHFADFGRLLNDLAAVYKVDAAAVCGSGSCFDALAEQAEKWLGGISALKDYTVLNNSIDALRRNGLSAVADAYENGSISEGNMESAYDREISRVIIGSIVNTVPELQQFQGAQFEDTIEKYRLTTAQFEEYTIKELVSALSAKIPDTSAAGAGSSELNILQKAIKSGGRNMPIRKLFDSIPNLLRRICPCMLMSPISVAQYIDPSFPKFDLVVFDEASQLPTCEAVGAIARGENVVVVGDPKQLPPTSFFSANQIDDENYDKEDLESVLDDCLALSMPQKHLLWHYRSRHESLIAYSNAKYYDNKLMTFPSPDDLVSKVKWFNVEGYYDKGGSKQNKAEGEAIIAEIVRRLSDEKLRKQSIGVVTFSLVQQNLIDDMLADEFMKNPQLEQWANEMYEPIFVKNLENVQGDERDVILFSIGYGPDKNGNVSMNFGPVNRDGGWRRLNVAISRARREMQVYSVIRPDQIDLNRTRSDGVAGLKGFLEFAAKGNAALAARTVSAAAENDDFEKIVAAEIEKLGYKVRNNIGCSEYKVDIGVVNPEKEDAYVLGVMCHGRKHIDTTTARDRNILQPSVLKGLGWKISNVWILDWLDNKQKVIDKLKRDIEQAIAEQDSPKEEPAAAKPERVLNFEREKTLSAKDKCAKYISCPVQQLGAAEQFYETSARPAMIKLMRSIIEAEAPISRRALLKKVLSAWGITRSGSRVEKVFDEVITVACGNVNSSNGSVFYWQENQIPAAYSSCRVSDSDCEKRSMDDICAEEIAAGIALVLENQVSMLKSDLIRETAKLFGYTRTGGVIETSIGNGIDYAANAGKISVTDERIAMA